MNADRIKGNIFILTFISYCSIVYSLLYEITLVISIYKAILLTMLSILDLYYKSIFVMIIIFIVFGDGIEFYFAFLKASNYEITYFLIVSHIITNLVLLFSILDMFISNKKYKIKPENKISEKSDCVICLEEIIEKIHTTKCSHRFHAKCIDEWCNKHNKNTCPKCRCTLFEQPATTDESI